MKEREKENYAFQKFEKLKTFLPAPGTPTRRSVPRDYLTRGKRRSSLKIDVFSANTTGARVPNETKRARPSCVVCWFPCSHKSLRFSSKTTIRVVIILRPVINYGFVEPNDNGGYGKSNEKVTPDLYAVPRICMLILRIEIKFEYLYDPDFDQIQLAIRRTYGSIFLWD